MKGRGEEQASTPPSLTHSRVLLVPLSPLRLHILGAYFMTGVTLYLLWRQYDEYVQLRHTFLAQAQPQNYTIVVRPEPIPDLRIDPKPQPWP